MFELRLGLADHFLPIRPLGLYPELVHGKTQYVLEGNSPGGDVVLVHFAQVRPYASLNVEMREVIRATLSGVPMVGDDFAALLILQGVEIRRRLYLPRAALPFGLFDTVCEQRG